MEGQNIQKGESLGLPNMNLQAHTWPSRIRDSGYIACVMIENEQRQIINIWNRLFWVIEEQVTTTNTWLDKMDHLGQKVHSLSQAKQREEA